MVFLNCFNLYKIVVGVVLVSTFQVLAQAPKPIKTEPVKLQAGDKKVTGEPEGDPNLKESVTEKSSGINEVQEVLGFLSPFEYSGKGRKDPFKPYEAVQVAGSGELSGPLLPLQRFKLEEIRLAGIIWDVVKPTALFIDPKGQTHNVGINARIGRKNGYVALIREGEVVIVETVQVRDEIIYNTKVLKLNN